MLRTLWKWSWRCASLFLIGFASFLTYLWFDLPDVGHLVDQNPTQTSYMRAWDAAKTTDTTSEISTWVGFEALPPLLIESLVNAEDARFFRHGGVEWGITRRMAWRVVRRKPATGASTITQQLARNLFLSGDVTLPRKIQEVMLALKLEDALSKERILELYVNVVEWGEDTWGIAAASEHYFSREPQYLGAFESVFLPGLLPAPRRELTGRNLYRAMGTYRRVCYHMQRIGRMSLDEWLQVKRGIAFLEIEMMQEKELLEVLALISGRLGDA